MDFTAEALDVVKALIPAVLVLITTVVIQRQLARRKLAEDRQTLRLQAFSSVMPLKMAAYERATLYLTRLQPDAILRRYEPTDHQAGEMARLILKEIKEEYDHNAVQQLYISDRAWAQVVMARNAVADLVIRGVEGVNEKASGTELAQKMADRMKDWENHPVEAALAALRAEISRYTP